VLRFPIEKKTCTPALQTFLRASTAGHVHYIIECACPDDECKNLFQQRANVSCGV
jgi:hypothetical protein